jgi:hypothetical protein
VYLDIQWPACHLSSTSSSPEISSMLADGVVPPVVDLNRTPVGGESSSKHRRVPRARDAADLPAGVNLVDKMPT